MPSELYDCYLVPFNIVGNVTQVHRILLLILIINKECKGKVTVKVTFRHTIMYIIGYI
jgi:hypothetical protein